MSEKSEKSKRSFVESKAEENANQDLEAKVKLLVRKRGQSMAKVTRARKVILETDDEFTQPQLVVYQKQLNQYYSEWHYYHDQILELVDDDVVHDHMDNCNTFEEKYMEVIAALEAIAIALGVSTEAGPSNEPRQMVAQVGDNQQANRSERIIIQQQPLKAPMPTFDGKYENWPKFKSMFIDLMSRSPDSDAIKLYHLDKALIGGAAGILDPKTISDNNYSHAWRILEERFENERVIVDNHIRGLLNLKKMSKESYKDLRELLDECIRHVENLKFHGQMLTGVSEQIVVNPITSALDKETRKQWESTLDHGELPNYEDTIQFLKVQCNILERCEAASGLTKSAQPRPAVPSRIPAYKSHVATSSEKSSLQCDFCGGEHINFSCPEFRKLNTSQRTQKVKSSKLCFNCLRKGHSARECTSDKSCAQCKKRHSTLLHFENTQSSNWSSKTSTINPEESKNEDSRKEATSNCVPTEPRTSGSTATSCLCNQKQTDSHVFLMTAIAQVVDNVGTTHQCRILLDCASQVSTIRAELTSKLGLPTKPVNTVVIGVNGKRSHISHEVSVSLRSRYDDFRTTVNCLVMDQVTSNLPTVSEDINSWELPSGIQLADPSFYVPGEVDILLGAKHFWSAMKNGKRKLGIGFPELRETHFGWVIVGARSQGFSAVQTLSCNVLCSEDINIIVQQFWELEQVPTSPTLSSEEISCEEFYQQSHRRDESGRYVVSLPFKNSDSELGDSRSMALKRFLFLERRLEKDAELRREYSRFLREYEELGHCEIVDESKDVPGTKFFYLPHHAVLRPSSTSTKLRVVFDASAKSSSGVSLNELLMVGPTVQDSLFAILLRFRRFQHVFSADLSKMYRQVRVDPSSVNFQRIFWRERPADPLKVFGLTTVTYGTASAPFLATRTLVQLAEDEQETFPIGAKILKENFYVDDCLCGFETFDEAAQAIVQLRGILEKGGFSIHKWCSNSQQLLDLVPKNEWEKQAEISYSNANQTIKTLGLLWEPKHDQFLFSTEFDSSFNELTPTKRVVLSTVARIFDPLGLISPVIVLGKLLIQDIWAEGLDWDEPLREYLLQRWVEFRTSLCHLAEINISRSVCRSTPVRMEQHGFADASQRAYGACVYLRSIYSDGTITMHLLCSKSRNAPKPDLTIPRLELCAAQLLARLILKTTEALQININDVVLWSDSQIVLAWLKKNPNQLEIFVRNRVTEIVTGTNHLSWKYVNSKDNPADIVSRGKSAGDLLNDDLWWHGPAFLRQNHYLVENPPELPIDEIPELRTAVVSAPLVEVSLEDFPVITNISNFRKLQRVFGYVLRFAYNCRHKNNRILSNHLTVPELRRSLIALVILTQRTSIMESDYKRVVRGEPCKQIQSLNPFIDDGVLRVGGRIQRSKLAFEIKHPMILPCKHPVVESLIRALHEEHLHVGPSGLLSAIRQRFWLVNGRSAVRRITRKCVTCFRSNPTAVNQLMGNLPESRVLPSVPFETTGVDFAGPVYIKYGVRRPAVVKAYISVFICMSTRAIHLELVSDMTAEAFVAALRRFTSRRGYPHRMFSDNGLNFIGANKNLKELIRLFKDQQTLRKINQFFHPREINWSFIPPRAPNFGGYWEAGVKNVKTHLKRVLGKTPLSFEEYATILSQIEAILNSRPLFADGSDPTEPSAITPGHFLIGRELTAIPEPLYDDSRSTLCRWKHLQAIRDHFWKRWSAEYLTQLQSRGKWSTRSPNVKEGMIVLLKEENLPPQIWKLAIITKTYPGEDGAVRVVDLKTADSIFRRSISKISPLPIEF